MRVTVVLVLLTMVGVTLLVVGAVLNYGPLSLPGGVILGFVLGVQLSRQAARDATKPRTRVRR